jgi:hypothetical protein
LRQHQTGWALTARVRVREEESAAAHDEETFTRPSEREWPRPWMRLFLESLSVVPDVSAACRYSGVGRRTAYNWREQLSAFAEAWDEAKQLQRDAFERTVHRWITTGLPVEEERVDEEFDESGKLVRRRVWTMRKAVRSERLAELWLKAWYGDRYRVTERGSRDVREQGPIRIPAVEELDRQIEALSAELRSRAAAV